MELDLDWRDTGETPFTEEELEQIRTVFRSLPTYKDHSIGAEDMPTHQQRIHFRRTPAQNKAFQDFLIRSHNGRLQEDFYLNLARTVHNTAAFARELVLSFDTDNNGFISEDEFQSAILYLTQHEPQSTYSGKTFEDFVKDADTNKDGKVSIEECTAWLIKQYPNINK